MIRSLALAILGGLTLAGGPSVAQDAAAGRQVAGMCRTCHGLDGYARIPMAPHIGGEPVAYLTEQLQAFRSGTRVNEMMSIVAGSLSDAQIADVAAWYSGHAATAMVPDGAAEAPGLCAGCHGEDGIAVQPGVPNLAGEDPMYLVQQLKAFRDGTRANEAMQAVTSGLTDAEISETSEWYAAVTLEIATPD